MHRYAGRSALKQRPSVFVQSTLGQVRLADQRAVLQREAEVPVSFTNQFDDVDVLRPALRWARFLEEDGTTRTDVYWSLHVRDLYPSRHVRRRLRKQDYEPTDNYVLAVSVAQQTAGYRTRVRYLNRHLIDMPRDSMKAETVIEPQTLTVRGDTGHYSLAVQWDAYWARPDEADSTRRLGPKLKTGTLRIDSLRALSPDPDRLEMSDLKPLFVADTDAPIEAAPPYPGAATLPKTPLALYFEVYHLAPADDGQTHYTIAYEVTYDERGEEVRTAASTRYSGEGQTAREIIHLDLIPERMGPFRITVQVTDESTGRAVERTLSFEVYQEPKPW